MHIGFYFVLRAPIFFHQLDDDEGEVYAELDSGVYAELDDDGVYSELDDDEGGVYAELDSGVYAELDDDVYSELDDATPFPDQELNRIGLTIRSYSIRIYISG
ncbi:hypothetical protein F8M41_015818 [Gigaspora margarita]|uniref:Uncharacterized protein n=1 Tax=Gigaspora margarita TaxID=4874 RepID=A0A8H4AQ54_GIGMA|nr:hypothetical protein F8M41_015818 [Gigaspora margarita]